MAWSESDLEQALDGSDASVAGGGPSTNDASGTKRSAALRGIAKGSAPRGEMNNTERRWAQRLDGSEEVLWWAYETVRIRYGDGGWHSPDFVLCRLEGFLEVHETKGGHMTDAGRTRFKAAAKALPVARWIMVMQKGKRQPWECKYDTANQGGAPFV